jgi:hypothetical protein
MVAILGKMLCYLRLSQGSKSSVIRLEYFVSTADYAYSVYI